jgi:hypothetical protein
LFTFPEQLPGPARFGKAQFMSEISTDDRDVAALWQLTVPLDVVSRQRVEDELKPFLNTLWEVVSGAMVEVPPSNLVTIFIGLVDDGRMMLAQEKSSTSAMKGLELVFEVTESATVDIRYNKREENWATVHFSASLNASLGALGTLIIGLAGHMPEETWKGRICDVDGTVDAFQRKHGETAVERLWEFLCRFKCTIATPGIPPRSESDLKRASWHYGKNTDYPPVLSDYLVQAYRESVKTNETALQGPVALDSKLTNFAEAVGVDKGKGPGRDRKITPRSLRKTIREKKDAGQTVDEIQKWLKEVKGIEVSGSVIYKELRLED